MIKNYIDLFKKKRLKQQNIKKVKNTNILKNIILK